MNREAKLGVVRRGWDAAAEGYDAHLAPWFSPWLGEAIAALDRPLPPGPIAAPCCGTGIELQRLAEHHPGREILGVDLSPGMAQVARERCKDLTLVRVDVGDATNTQAWPICAGVLSTFGLQQMPEPEVALAAWLGALAPGGVLSVVYWPKSKEQEGPFAWLGQALQGKVPPADFSWESKLVSVIEAAGARILRDEIIRFELKHENAEDFWSSMTTAGPLRSMALARGPDFMSEVRGAFLGAANVGPVAHHPGARHLVAQARLA
jgi:ubiquinone/menaquinone biosynthesis C-methylase UbiE